MKNFEEKGGEKFVSSAFEALESELYFKLIDVFQTEYHILKTVKEVSTELRVSEEKILEWVNSEYFSTVGNEDMLLIKMISKNGCLSSYNDLRM
jgi:methionyl-tRNA synthetase